MAKEISLCRATSNLSNVMGNVSFIVRDFIVGLFPKDFFDRVHIDTKLSELYMEEEEYFKASKPILIIRPRFSLDDNTYFERLPDWMSTNYFVFKELQGNYTPVFYDEKKLIYIYSVPDRIKITYEIEIIASSRMQQLNIAHFLKGSVLHKSYFYLNDAYIETEVPKYFIKVLADYMNYDLRVPKEKGEFLEYLDSHSQSFITEKTRASSGNPAYFYIYSANILSLFEDNPQLDDGEEEGQNKKNFRITETLSTEFSCPMNFFLETNQPRRPMPQFDEDYSMSIFEDKISLNYTMKFIPPKFVEHNGIQFDFVKKSGYITDDNKTIDKLDLRDFFSEDFKEVIAYNNKYRISNDDAFYIKLYYNEKEVLPDLVKIDWNTLTLSNITPRTNTTYHIFLYVNKLKVTKTINRIHEIRKEIYHDK